MEILGVGLPELFFVVLLALVLLGPKDMAETGHLLGRWLNRFIKSDAYKMFTQTIKELKSLPTKLMREANLEEAQADTQTWQEDVKKNLIGGVQAPKRQTHLDEKDLFVATPEEPTVVDSPSPDKNETTA